MFAALALACATEGIGSPAVAERRGNKQPAAPPWTSLRLKAGQFDPLRDSPGAMPLPAVEHYPEGVRGGFLVQFDHPITQADRDALEATGATVNGYVPMMALEVVMTEAQREGVEGLAGVRWVGPYQPSFKLGPDLAAQAASPRDAGETLRLQVNLFPSDGGVGLEGIRALGGSIRNPESGRSLMLVQVAISAGRLAALARVPQVRFIEELPTRVALNDRARLHTGLALIADDRFASGADPGLDGWDQGSGFRVKYGHMDTGIEASHPEFGSAAVTFEPGADTADLDDGHGTHTAASIVGNGSSWASVPEPPPASGAPSEGKWRGITPEAALHHISFENYYTDRQTFEREVEEGAQISTNSWGYGNVQGSITDYNSNAAVWDEGVWDADDDVAGQQPLVAFFSAGNDGGFVSPYDGCNSDGGDRIGSPALAKNVITVGMNETDRGAGSMCGSASTLGDNVEQVNASSSRGPVDPDLSGQGLFKPDVVNIGGYWVLSAEASGTASDCDPLYLLPDCPQDCSDTGPAYAYNNGTSMSCPLTAGLGGVLYQDLVVHRGVPAPRPSLIKALLINGARELHPSACNYTLDVSSNEIHQGWGFVQAPASLYGPGGAPGTRNVEFENEETSHALATGDLYERQVEINGGTPLKITLVWTDYPASAGAGSPLVVNDLDLELEGPDGLYLGNNFADAWSVAGGQADRYNVVESVILQNPLGGLYTVRIRGFQVSQDQEPGKPGINQDFSLVWSGDLQVTECADGLCEGAETGCSCPQDCGPPPITEIACTDNRDDDCDERFDCADEDCLGDAACQPLCGDGVCDPTEDCFTCVADCPTGGGAVCGNGTCEAANNEDCSTCPQDCDGIQTGPPSGRFCCGQGGSCADSRCNAAGFACSEQSAPIFCCGDGWCEGDENLANCQADCSLDAGEVVAAAGGGAADAPLRVTGGPGGLLALSWDGSCSPTDTDYVVYEGTLGDYASHRPRLCSTAGATFATIPPLAGDRYYLIVPRNATREGSYGRSSDGRERGQGTVACLAQQASTCPANVP